jgi:hypothetical protein
MGPRVGAQARGRGTSGTGSGRGGLWRDADGNEWEGFQNEYQQRQLRCIAGSHAGQVIHDPRLKLLRPEQPTQHPGGFDDSGTMFSA